MSHFAGFASMHFLFVHHVFFPTPFYTEYFEEFYTGRGRAGRRGEFHHVAHHWKRDTQLPFVIVGTEKAFLNSKFPLSRTARLAITRQISSELRINASTILSPAQSQWMNLHGAML